MQDDDMDSTLNFGLSVNPDDIWNFSSADNELIASTSAFNLQSSDSSQEHATETAQPNQSYTSLLPLDEPMSSTVDSTTDFQRDFYTYEWPDRALSTSNEEIKKFEDQYEFHVQHPKEEMKASKSASWTYSPTADELYVKMNVDCPLLFKIKGRLPLGTYIRATPLYIRPEDMNNFPKRCLNHSAEQHETNRGCFNNEHLIRSSLVGTRYTKDAVTGRMSTILPIVPPELGSSLSSCVVRFMCMTSCPGGMNRRPMAVLFTLEHNGKCLGRQKRKVKVCACPGRDRQNEESRLQRLTSATRTYENRAIVQDVKRACKRVSASLSTNGQPETKQRKLYTMTLHSRAQYKFLSALIPILENYLGTREESSEDEG